MYTMFPIVILEFKERVQELRENVLSGIHYNNILMTELGWQTVTTSSQGPAGTTATVAATDWRWRRFDEHHRYGGDPILVSADHLHLQ